MRSEFPFGVVYIASVNASLAWLFTLLVMANSASDRIRYPMRPAEHLPDGQVLRFYWESRVQKKIGASSWI